MITVGSLCTGAGGLDLAVADVLGDVRTAWVADPDPDAARVLAARFPDLVDNTAALRLCGAGVVRQQGAAAYRLLGVGLRWPRNDPLAAEEVMPPGPEVPPA